MRNLFDLFIITNDLSCAVQGSAFWVEKPLTRLYETTSKWHSFFLDQIGRLRPSAGLNLDDFVESLNSDGSVKIGGEDNKIDIVSAVMAALKFERVY